MSRTWTTDELRNAYSYLKKAGLCKYDYDDIVRLDKQGRLLIPTEVYEKIKPALNAIIAKFKCIDTLQIVKTRTTGQWALYLEAYSDNISKQQHIAFADGYDDVKAYIPEIDEILQEAHKYGIDISHSNVHAEISSID